MGSGAAPLADLPDAMSTLSDLQAPDMLRAYRRQLESEFEAKSERVLRILQSKDREIDTMRGELEAAIQARIDADERAQQMENDNVALLAERDRAKLSLESLEHQLETVRESQARATEGQKSASNSAVAAAADAAATFAAAEREKSALEDQVRGPSRVACGAEG